MPDIIPTRQSCIGLQSVPSEACLGLDPGWRPVRVKKTRQIKNLEPRFDSIETDKALALLTERAGHVIFGSAVTLLAFAARQGHFCGGFLRRVGSEAVALPEAFGLTELVSADLAVRRAIGGHGASHTPRHHRRWLGQTRQAVARILGRFLGPRVQILHGFPRG